MTRVSASSERGGVLILVALWMPLFVLLASFVLDAGNWFEHRRHLQLQADAGAFAAGGVFNGCFGDPTAANTAILTAARTYAGDPGSSGVYNTQVGGARKGTVTVRINSKLYQVGGPPPPGDDTVELPPCDAKMVDVKMTEAGLKWFLAGNVVGAINARARVEIQQKGSSSNSLPVGVPDNNPLAAAAIFVDETNGTILGTQTLVKNPTTTVSLNGETVFQWTAPTALSLNITHANTGVIVALAGQAGWTPSGATLTDICNQVLIECYSVTQDNTGAVTGSTGLDFIHGYTTMGTGSVTAPILRDVTLTNVGCTDGSGPYFLLNSACTVGVRAKVDFGTGTADPTLTPTFGQLKVGGWGCPGGGQNPKGCPMTYNTTGPNAGYFTTTAVGGLALMPNDGLGHAIDLNWGTGSGSGRRDGTFSSAQRSFSANIDTSGSVAYVRVDNETGSFSNSLEFGAHSFTATVGVRQSRLGNQSSPTAPVISLKVVGGSATQAIDCDPSKANLRDELANGCTPQYTTNEGTPCQAASSYTFPQSAPWDCTKTQPGGQVGQVSDGMLCRIYRVCYSGTPNCASAPIRWRDANGDGKITIPEDVPPSDPRLVSVFVTPFGAFSGNGQNVVSITDFATFYVTGFSKNGGGQGDPCNGSPAPDPVPSKTGGYIVGHFIKYVDTIGGGGTGELCDFNAFGSCVVVLTR